MQDFVIPTYEKDFSKAVDEIAAVINRWSVSDEPFEPPINSIVDCVYIKRSTRIISHANHAYVSFYGNGQSVTGMTGESFLDPAMVGIAQKSDDLLISSGWSVEFEHVSVRADGLSYQCKTHKRWLGLNARGNSILGVSRVLSVIERPAQVTMQRLAAIAQKYESLDSNDRALCCLMAAGHSQRDMAELLGCTTRTVENRRNRIMEELGASKPIEIVKLMVRLAEHGLIPADF